MFLSTKLLNVIAEAGIEFVLLSARAPSKSKILLDYTLTLPVNDFDTAIPSESVNPETSYEPALMLIQR